MTKKNLFTRDPTPAPTIAQAEFVCATVTAVTASGVRILVDGETTATQKEYKRLASYAAPAVGDRVVAMQQSGTFVILGPISNGGASAVLPIEAGGSGCAGTFVTQDIDEILTTNEDYEVSSASYAQWGKLATLYVAGEFKKASSSSSDDTTAFTMVAGKRPKVTTAARAWRNANAILYWNGNMVYHGLAVTGTGATFLATYLLA